MKLLNYKLQNQIEALGENKPTNYFKDYLKAVLEDTNTTYFQKCDYLGLSLSEIKSKIDTLSGDISELQELKKNLSTALEIAKELIAEIFIENGIDRIDGNIISSLTLSKESTKPKDEIRILDENALMDLGYVKFSIDMDALKADINAGKADELKDFVEVSTTYSIVPAKIKVNKKRSGLKALEQTDEILEQVAEEAKMFNDQQTKALSSELSADRIKVRDKANIKLSYLEGFDIIDTANSIFGFGGWAYTISSLEQVSQEVNANQNVVVCYKAIVKVDVYDINHSTMISRQDVGFGTGVARNLADAHENSAKEAVTDALKRSLRSFGNQFGNSLYDKSKSVAQNNAPSNMPNAPANQNAGFGQNQAIPNQAPNQAMPSQIPNQAMPNQVPNDQVMGDIQSLRNMGLDVVEQNGFLLVRGNNIFAKKDTIKALGFRWDSKTKQWYKQLSNAA